MKRPKLDSPAVKKVLTRLREYVVLYRSVTGVHPVKATLSEAEYRVVVAALTTPNYAGMKLIQKSSRRPHARRLRAR